MKSQGDEFKKRLYLFTLKLVEFIEGLSRDIVSRRIGDQLLRSGTSIIGNFVEGKASSSRKEFTNFLSISLKSTNESKLWFCLLRDTKRAEKTEVEWFLEELEAFGKILGKSIITLKQKKES